MKVKDVSNRYTSAKNPIATPIYPKGIISEGRFKLLAKTIQVWATKPVIAMATIKTKNLKLACSGYNLCGCMEAKTLLMVMKPI